ncbi:helix-turn-helix domain-containing protein [Neobacillus vireti]|uniref:helix-turn-helix domain-containing protein n=1 Tax=Neobacillus vireti TaxID=220686 RepID=UPI002FFD9FC5
MTVIISSELIFEHGNKHMMEKLRSFGSQGKAVIKYIISKLRKYHGSFFESNSTIAQAVGCSVRTVQNTVKKAEQLNIFAVSPRKELDELTGKIRQTTNLIQLLPFTPLKKVKKVIIEGVREVKNKARLVVSKVKEMVENVDDVIESKKENKSNISQKQDYNEYLKLNQFNGQKWSKKVIRTEVIPDWFEDSKDYYSKLSVKEEQTLKKKKKSVQELLVKLSEAGF